MGTSPLRSTGFSGDCANSITSSVLLVVVENAVVVVVEIVSVVV